MGLLEEKEKILAALGEIRPGQTAPEGAGQRDKIIIRTSILGILANTFLAVFKAGVGIVTNSIAITLDAVNNLSDAGSSLITIIGTKLAGREPDKKHPFGYGRIEYLSALVIAVIILYAGISSFTEAVKQILHPETPNYSTPALIIVTAGIIVKVLLSQHVKHVGKQVKSDSLVNSGEEASMDAVVSVSTLAAAFIFLKTGISLEAWLGAVISVIIIRSGIEMVQDTISRLLGEQADAETARGIKATVLSFPKVQGAYDLVLNNYGPEAFNGSIHIEVPDTCSAAELDELIREITVKVYKEHHVLLTAIGVYSVNTGDAAAIKMREKIYAAAFSHKEIPEVHGFYVNEEKKTIRFDVVISLSAGDRRAVCREVYDQVHAMYPDYDLQIALDSDFSEL